MEEKRYPCPSCGFEVFTDPPGSYDICPLCDWEDDHVQLTHPTIGGGANKLSLAEHQKQVLQQLPVAVSSANGFVRAKLWRPLQPHELALSSEPVSRAEYFQAAGADSPRYYWLHNEKL